MICNIYIFFILNFLNKFNILIRISFLMIIVATL